MFCFKDDDEDLSSELQNCCDEGKYYVLDNCEMDSDSYDTEKCYKRALACCNEDKMCVITLSIQPSITNMNLTWQ